MLGSTSAHVLQQGSPPTSPGAGDIAAQHATNTQQLRYLTNTSLTRLHMLQQGGCQLPVLHTALQSKRTK
eukprot:CAMPEP_0202899654 /NCGR_PEP_ID=MMETSP1392-20130828/7835_1 /ASSEMBLY_ACC=CAM_ASM_000868 /TAXON_ID=225041 /ORGANISM="Chlamydomonas chlamydogama, Strain SAG 11-48b" /LENGTH=69 /DNA_ID=CAMNT_0049585899 /DNA_START=658 /DNA_END=867 /DNA_ORIENTATION=+